MDGPDFLYFGSALVERSEWSPKKIINSVDNYISNSKCLNIEHSVQSVPHYTPNEIWAAAVVVRGSANVKIEFY